MSATFEQLEAQLKTLGENKGILTTSKKQTIRDRVFQSIGQVELADAIATGETKADLAVSLTHLQKALIPHRLSFSMPATVAVVILIFMGSVVTGAAAQSSRPGDILFNVRKVLETIELAMVTNPIKKAAVSLDIADQRLKDLEASVGTEAALNIILKESQIALVSAQATLQKAQVGGDTEQTVALLDKLNALLNDQKILLEDIEKAEPSEDIKQTIVAIRDVIAGGTEKPGGIATTVVSNPSGSTSVVAPGVVKPAVKPAPDINKPPVLANALEGFQTIAGRLGTANGKPAIFMTGNQYLIIASSPVSLQEYIGAGNVAFSGTIKDGYMTVYRVVINGNVLADTPFPQTNPVSTGGANMTDQTENPDQPANQE
ncbi:MAG: DUF5667 domain-containing protein [Patescibacteria group bacterium]